jgi:hypothetical protein
LLSGKKTGTLNRICVDHRASLDLVEKKNCRDSNKSKESVPGFNMRVSDIITTSFSVS